MLLISLSNCNFSLSQLLVIIFFCAEGKLGQQISVRIKEKTNIMYRVCIPKKKLKMQSSILNTQVFNYYAASVKCNQKGREEILRSNLACE